MTRDTFKAKGTPPSAAPHECHCGTCTCNPNMTPAVRFDLSPTQKEGAIREHLIRLGWTPPVGAAEDMVLDAIERRKSSTPAAVDEAAVKRAVAAVMSAPAGISVEAYVRIVLEAALLQQPAPVGVKPLSEFMAEQEALHPGIHDKVQAAADELRASLAQQQGQAVVWVSEADIAPFIGAPQMAEFWGTVTLASGPGDGRTVPLYLTAPPSTSVEDGPIDANDNAEYIEHCADRLERCGLPVTGGVLRAIAQEHRALTKQPAAAHESCAAVAAIQFALTDPEGMTFLKLWNEGEFDTLRREWPDALRKIYGGADPLA